MTSLAPADGIRPSARPDMSFLFDRAAHVLRTQMAAALAEIGLTPRMQCVLVHALEEERTQAQLAEIGDMDKTTMVVTVDALEKAGYAERRPARTDRRARIIAVTSEGAKVAAKGQMVVDRVHGALVDAVPEESREAFVRALEGLVEGHLSRAVEAPAPVRRARQAG